MYYFYGYFSNQIHLNYARCELNLRPLFRTPRGREQRNQLELDRRGRRLTLIRRNSLKRDRRILQREEPFLTNIVKAIQSI